MFKRWLCMAGEVFFAFLKAAVGALLVTAAMPLWLAGLVFCAVLLGVVCWMALVMLVSEAALRKVEQKWFI